MRDGAQVGFIEMPIEEKQTKHTGKFSALALVNVAAALVLLTVGVVGVAAHDVTLTSLSGSIAGFSETNGAPSTEVGLDRFAKLAP